MFWDGAISHLYFFSWQGPQARGIGCVPEGSLAGVFGCHEMALELVSGADFWCKLMFRASPGDLGGPRGRFPA